ncbi:MAG: class I SAM-dependent methyltransferase [Gammaproteobacteria bacterium]|nr:class I SAM-dependent methyltransferase [Gammaproteobacteria bacterium]
MMTTDSTDFGFQKILPEDKSRRVAKVFSSVSSRYDLMNDLMSIGVHRLWKRFAVHISGVKKGQTVLDVAGGTGDLAFLFHQRVGEEGRVLLTDINNDMLMHGRNKFIDKGIINGINCVQADVEHLPFQENSFDCICIAFGLRNVTDKQAALKSIYEKTKYGGCIIILEFSVVILSWLKRLYDAYSFKIIPWLGKVVANDEESYRYLVESIRMHPDQETLKHMIEDAGFTKVDYYNLSGGIVAIHKAYKL